MLTIYIGYDKNEIPAYHVLAESILSRASGPVSIVPLKRELLPKAYNRERGPLESTDFSMSRFLVPWLHGPSGRCIFMDCDMLCLGDVYELEAVSDDTSPVSVVQHDYTPKGDTKFLGQLQTQYEKKNWSSLMVFNCYNYDCHRLRPEVVSKAEPLWLHQFKWVNQPIGALPREWNYLVGELPKPAKTPKLIHFTQGGPWFPEYRDCDYADLWRSEAAKVGISG